MKRRAALPRSVKHSETLERLIRLRRDFAVLPYGADSDKWKSSVRRKHVEDAQEEHKRLIREADTGIKGIEFPAEVMAIAVSPW